MKDDKDREKLESLLIDYIDGKLNSVDKHYVEQELLKNPKSFKIYEELKEVVQLMNRKTAEAPTDKLRASFTAFLEDEIRANRKSKVIALNPWWYRVAAAVAFLVVGVSLGYIISAHNQRKAEIARIEAENRKTTQLVSMIANPESAGQRILAVKEAVEDEDLNKEILEALVKTLNTDPNPNVRMAALEGLRKFYDDPEVRKALVASLARQDDAVVQITLIQILVEMKEKGAVKPLKEMIQREELIPAVKDEAQMGVLTLS